MTTIDATTPGQFCWIELATTDLARAKAFYLPLLGWSTKEEPAGDMGTYTMFTKGAVEIAGAYELTAEMRASGVPPHWMIYVSVASADAAVERARGLGATVAVPPMDVMDIGRMAVLQDPAGAGFAVWEPRNRKGETLRGEPGGPCWFELVSRDSAAALRFYTELFGWTLAPQKIQTPMGEVEYTRLRHEDCDVGGAMQMGPEFGETPSHWMVYLQVADLDATLAGVPEHGGTVVAGPLPVPEVGRFLIAQDATGAAVTFMQLDAAGA